MEIDPTTRQRQQALSDFMKRNKLNISRWEEASGLGSGTVRKFFKRTAGGMNDVTYVQLAAGASKLLQREVEIEELQKSPAPAADTVADSLSTASHVMLEDRQRLQPAPSLPEPLPKERDEGIPIMGTSLAGSEGDFQLNSGEPIDRVPTPRHLKDRRGLFILYVEGTSMVPWKKPRQLVWLDEKIRPQNGDHVVVELKPTPPYEDRPAFLKLLVRVAGSKLILRQYAPDKTFDVPVSRVHKIYRVMTEEEVMGIGRPLF